MNQVEKAARFAALHVKGAPLLGGKRRSRARNPAVLIYEYTA